MQLQDVLNRLDRWLEVNVPDDFGTLNPPATASEIDAITENRLSLAGDPDVAGASQRRVDPLPAQRPRRLQGPTHGAVLEMDQDLELWGVVRWKSPCNLQGTLRSLRVPDGPSSRRSAGRSVATVRGVGRYDADRLDVDAGRPTVETAVPSSPTSVALEGRWFRDG